MVLQVRELKQREGQQLSDELNTQRIFLVELLKEGRAARAKPMTASRQYLYDYLVEKLRVEEINGFLQARFRN